MRKYATGDNGRTSRLISSQHHASPGFGTFRPHGPLSAREGALNRDHETARGTINSITNRRDEVQEAQGPTLSARSGGGPSGVHSSGDES